MAGARSHRPGLKAVPSIADTVMQTTLWPEGKNPMPVTKATAAGVEVERDDRRGSLLDWVYGYDFSRSQPVGRRRYSDQPGGIGQTEYEI